MQATVQSPRPPLAWMWWIPAIVWAAVIFYLSTKTSAELPKFDIPYLDKIVHFILYGGLSFLIFCGARFGRGMGFSAAMALACVLASLYGISDEFHQTFTAGRSRELLDWVADTLGAATVFLAPAFRPKESSTI